MAYETDWKILDKDKDTLTKHTYICFSPLLDTPFKDKAHYLQYDFHNSKCTEDEMYQYFLFLKAIPEFKHLLKGGCKALAQKKKYTYNLTTGNGMQLFVILTLLRAVVEDPKIIRKVIQFDRKKKYSLNKLGILKACGAVLTDNNNHWITMAIHKDNVNKGLHDTTLWNSKTPAKETGLTPGLHNVFMYDEDGWAVSQPVKLDYVNEVLKEDKPIAAKVRTQSLKKVAEWTAAPAF